MQLKQILLDHLVYMDLLTNTHSKSMREYCGFFLGLNLKQTIIVNEAVSAQNAIARPGSFAIPDYELQRIKRRAKKLNLKIVAVYHFHSSGNLILSDTDRRAMIYTYIPWVLFTHTDQSTLMFAAFDAVSGSQISIEITSHTMNR